MEFDVVVDGSKEPIVIVVLGHVTENKIGSAFFLEFFSVHCAIT